MTDLVVVLWRPDTTTGRGPPATPDKPYLTWIGGQWASDKKIYKRDELPTSYRGQDTWPKLSWFERLADAVAYLTDNRDHTACQLALDEFRRCFPDVALTESFERDH